MNSDFSLGKRKYLAKTELKNRWFAGVTFNLKC